MKLVNFQPNPLTSLPQGNTLLSPTAHYVFRQTKKVITEKALDTSLKIQEDAKLFQIIREVESSLGEVLSDKERTEIVNAIQNSLLDFGILEQLIQDNNVNDIIISSYNEIYIQVKKVNQQTKISFPDQESYKAFVEQILKKAGKSCTLANPIVDFVIGQDIRINCIHESLCPNNSGPYLSIRITRHKFVDLDFLTHEGLAPKIVLEYLAALIKKGNVSMLIAGEVGTGKTTLAKALLSVVPENEAILIVEDTLELALKRKFVRNIIIRDLNSEGLGKISHAQAIKAGMRMAMNRLVLGEMRDWEAAEAFIDVASSGHSCLSTIHAKTARDALSRIELFLIRAQPQLAIESIKKQIANSIDLVVHLELDKKLGEHKISEIIEIGTFSDDSIQVSPMFIYEEGVFKRGSGQSQHLKNKKDLYSREQVYSEKFSSEKFLTEKSSTFSKSSSLQKNSERINREVNIVETEVYLPLPGEIILY